MNRQNFVIQTNRLILRDLNTKDLEKIYELGSDTAVTKYLDYIKFNNLKDAEAWLNEAIRYNSEKPRRSYNLGIITVIDNEFIGWVGIGESSQSNDVWDFGIAIFPKYHKLGYAREALTAVLNYCNETLNIKEIIGDCNKDNKSSEKMMLACGMKPIQVADQKEKLYFGFFR